MAAELTRRNLSIYLWPDINKIDATQFTPYEAQLLLKCKNDPDPGPLVSSIYQNPFPSLTQSETLLVYLVWSLALDLPKFTSQFKVYFANQIYFSKIPQMVNDLLDQPGIADIIADIIKGLPPQYKQP